MVHLLTLASSYNFKTIYSNDIEKGSNLIYLLYKHWKYERMKNEIILKPKRFSNDTNKTAIEYYGFNSIYLRKVCRKLLKSFKTIKNIINQESLYKTSIKIWRILNDNR